MNNQLKVEIGNGSVNLVDADGKPWATCIVWTNLGDAVKFAQQLVAAWNERIKLRTGPHTKACTLDDLPAGLQNGLFLTLWLAWVDERSKRHQPLTERAARMQLSKLAEWGLMRAMQSIRNSIERGWQGLFEPRGECAPSNSGREQHTQRSWA